MDLYCHDCKRKFTFSQKEQKFFSDNDWDYPIRCPECRKKHKKAVRHMQELYRYNGWEGTMYPDFQHKHRHSRAPYAPFTIGGMR